MRKSTIEKIEKEIDERTKVPHKVKDNMKKEAFVNIVICVVLILYLIFIVLGSIGTIKNVRVIDINIFSIIFLTLSIIMFEIAYKKDSGSFAMYGIESLVVAAFTLFLPYIIYELDEVHRKYYLMSSIYIAVYYIIKCIYIAIRSRAKYMNTISDVKEIIKKDDRDIMEEMGLNKVVIDTEEETIVKASKKRGRPKKTNKDEVKRIEIKKESNTPKKRGRPRKSETKSVENKTEKVEAPKRKRGRPRKVDE